MIAAPTQTIIKTISKSIVLSSALVPELKILYYKNYIDASYTASIRQNIKGPHRSPNINVNKLNSYNF